MYDAELALSAASGIAKVTLTVEFGRSGPCRDARHAATEHSSDPPGEQTEGEPGEVKMHRRRLHDDVAEVERPHPPDAAAFLFRHVSSG